MCRRYQIFYVKQAGQERAERKPTQRTDRVLLCRRNDTKHHHAGLSLGAPGAHRAGLRPDQGSIRLAAKDARRQ